MGDGTYFVSYSGADAAEFVRRLTDDLTLGSPAYRMWVDTDQIRPAGLWDDQLVEAIRDCEAMLFVITADSVNPQSVCRLELGKARTYKKPIIPLRLGDDAEAPLLLTHVQEIRFDGDYERGLTRLREHLDWMGTVEGRRQNLRDLHAYTQHTLRRTPPERRAAVEADLADLERQIQALTATIEDPGSVSDQTQRRIDAGLDRARQPRRPTGPVSDGRPRFRFVNAPPVIAPDYFQGRDAETAQLGAALRAESVRMVTVSGRGGVGKSALVCRLLRAVETRTPLPEAGPVEIDGIVYLSPAGDHPLDFPTLFNDLCQLLPDAAARELRSRFKAPEQTPSKLIAALLEHFARRTADDSPAAPGHCNVVLLDNFEDVIDPQTGAIRDVVLDEAIRALLKVPDHTVKLIITTRETPRRLALYQPQAQQHIQLDTGLESPFAEAVLRAYDPDGSLGLRDAPEEQLTLAKERTRGFPHALEALASILSADRGTSLPELLQETRELPENVVYALVGEAYSRLDPSSQEVIQALAVLPRPVPSVAVDFLLAPFRPEIDAAPVLSRLVNMRFVYAHAGQYSLHQVDRDFARSRLAPDADHDALPHRPTDGTQQGAGSTSMVDRLLRRRRVRPHVPAARRTELSLPELHDRAVRYFRSVRTPRDTWRTWEDLGPQLAEFQLRLQNDDVDEAVSILQSIDFEYLLAWGHYATTLNLYLPLLDRISDSHMLAKAHNNVGNSYSSLGRSRLAVEHYSRAWRIAREAQDSAVESDSLGNLAICSLNEGRLAEAERQFEEAIAIHREIGARSSESTASYYLARCLVTRGRLAEGMERYGEALELARATGTHQVEVAAQDSLGDCHMTLGNIELAKSLYNQSLDTARRVGARPMEASTMCSIASADFAVGRIGEALEQYDRALAIYEEIGETGGKAAVLGSIGDCELTTGRPASAMRRYDEALEAAVHMGQRTLEANLRNSIGNAHVTLGHTAQAFEEYERALTIYREIGDAAGQTVALGSIGDYELTTGKPAEAMQRYEEALNAALQIGQRNLEANLRSSIGNAHVTLGHTALAFEQYEQALTIYREIGDVSGQAATLGNIGNSELTTGQTTMAMQRYEEALTLAESAGIRQIQANLNTGIGDVHVILGRTARALEQFERSLTLYREIGDAAGQAVALGNIGNCELATGRTTAAMQRYEQALATAVQIGQRSLEANLRGSIGNAHVTLGHTALAFERYEQALAIYREIGDAGGQAATLGNIGSCDLTTGYTTRALDRYEQALALAESAGLRQVQANLHVGIGNVHMTRGRTEQALEQFEQALGIYRQIGDAGGQAAALCNIGNCHASIGRPGTALEHYDLALVSAKQHNLQLVEATTLSALALAEADQGLTGRALATARKADAISGGLDPVEQRMHTRLALATVCLLGDDAATALATAEEAVEIMFTPARPTAFVLCGMANLRSGHAVPATANFRAAIELADGLLARDASNCLAHHNRGLAHSGLALTGKPAGLDTALAAFESLLALTGDTGVVARTLALLDVMDAVDPQGLLNGVRAPLLARLSLSGE